MKLFLLFLSGVLLITAYAEDVKVVSDKDSVCVTNGKIKLEISESGDIKFSSKNGTTVDVALFDNTPRTKIKASRWGVEKNTAEEAVINLYTGNPVSLLATCTLKKDSEYLTLDPGYRVSEAFIKTGSDIAVLPDIIGENYIYYPEKIKNFCLIPYDAYCLLNLMNNGSAMFALMWNSDETQVFLGKDSQESKKFDYNKIKLGRHKTLALGIIEAPGIWHVVKEKLDKKEFTKVDWQAPFPSEWLMTTKVEKGFIPVNDGNYDAWIIPRRTDGMKGSLMFKTKMLGFGISNASSWTAYGYWISAYTYPCYFKDNHLYAKVPASQAERLSFDSDYHPVIYTYRHETAAKDGRILPYEYLKDFLDADRYQHLDFIRDVEARYPGTCGTIDKTWRIFKDETFEEDKDLLIKQLDLMDKFVNTTDKRINDYRKWTLNEIAEIKRQSAEKQELKETAETLIGYLQEIDVEINKLKEKIRTPEYSKQASQKIIELIEMNISGEEKENECNKLGREIRLMGHNRDNLCSILRLNVKSIRYHIVDLLSNGTMTEDEASFLIKIRKDCGEILRIRHGVEGK
jgi:hypothetical protein